MFALILQALIIMFALILQAVRLPTGGSPRNYGSPAQDFGVRKSTLTKRSGATPVNLNHRSMSADLERAEAYDASDAYPASPSEQQVSCGFSYSSFTVCYRHQTV